MHFKAKVFIAMSLVFVFTAASSSAHAKSSKCFRTMGYDRSDRSYDADGFALQLLKSCKANQFLTSNGCEQYRYEEIDGLTRFTNRILRCVDRLSIKPGDIVLNTTLSPIISGAGGLNFFLKNEDADSVTHVQIGGLNDLNSAARVIQDLFESRPVAAFSGFYEIPLQPTYTLIRKALALNLKVAYVVPADKVRNATARESAEAANKVPGVLGFKEQYEDKQKADPWGRQPWGPIERLLKVDNL